MSEGPARAARQQQLAGPPGAGDGSAPDVTIVIIAHSAKHDLVRCLSSIDDYRGELAVETILYDNASTDGTVEWVREEHPEVRVVPLAENEGVAARSRGIDAAAGRYIMFLDSDAALTSGALPAMVAAMDANSGWGLLGPRLIGDDRGPQASCRRFPPPYLPLLRRPPLARWLEDSRPVRRHLMEDVDCDRVRPVVYVLGACQLFRSSLARRANPFPTWVFLGPDDIDWCLSIRDAGGEVVYWPEATVIHSYQRRSRRHLLSRLALLHLKGFAELQWRHRGRRAEYARLADRLDARVE